MKPYICEFCENPCNGIWVDYGIGEYEFWGSKGSDVDVLFVSDCCESPLELREPEEY